MRRLSACCNASAGVLGRPIGVPSRDITVGLRCWFVEIRNVLRAPYDWKCVLRIGSGKADADENTRFGCFGFSRHCRGSESRSQKFQRNKGQRPDFQETMRHKYERVFLQSLVRLISSNLMPIENNTWATGAGAVMGRGTTGLSTTRCMSNSVHFLIFRCAS